MDKNYYESAPGCMCMQVSIAERVLKILVLHVAFRGSICLFIKITLINISYIKSN